MAAALAELRRIRQAGRPEWDRLHEEAIAAARYAGASYEEIDRACVDPGDGEPDG